MSDSPRKAKQSEEELQMAIDDLEVAQFLIEGNYSEVAVTRLYYSCFHAASAVLLDQGFDPNTHSGVKMLFGREVVNSGDAAGRDGRFLKELFEARQIADYNATMLDVSEPPLETDLETLFDRVEQFVGDMEELVV